MYQPTELQMKAFEIAYSHLYDSVTDNPTLQNDLHTFILQYSKLEAAEEKIFNCHLICFVHKLGLPVKEALSLWEAFCEKTQNGKRQSPLHYLLDNYIKNNFEQKNHTIVLKNSVHLKEVLEYFDFYTQKTESAEIFKKIEIYLNLAAKEILRLLTLDFEKMIVKSSDLLTAQGYTKRLEDCEKLTQDYYPSIEIMLGLKNFAERKKILDFRYAVNRCLLSFYENVDPIKYASEMQLVHMNTLNLEAMNVSQHFAKGEAYFYLKNVATLQGNYPAASNFSSQSIHHFVQVINFNSCEKKRYNTAMDKLTSSLFGYIYCLYFQPNLSDFFSKSNHYRFLKIYETYEKEYRKNMVNMEKLNIKIDLLVFGLFVNVLQQTFINENLQTIAQMIKEVNQILDTLIADGKESSIVKNRIKKKLEDDYKIIVKSMGIIEICDRKSQNQGPKELSKLTDLIRESIKSSIEINDNLRLALLYTHLMKTAKVKALAHCESALVHLTHSIEFSMDTSYDEEIQSMFLAVSGMSKMEIKSQLKEVKEALLQFLIQIPKGSKVLTEALPLYVKLEKIIEFFRINFMHSYHIAYSDILIALVDYYESLGKSYPIYKELRARIMSQQLPSYYCLISPIRIIESYTVVPTINYCKKYIEIFQKIEANVNVKEVVYVFTRLFELLKAEDKLDELLSFINLSINLFPEEPFFLREKMIFISKKLQLLFNITTKPLQEIRSKVLLLGQQMELKEKQLLQASRSIANHPKMQFLWTTLLQLGRDFHTSKTQFYILLENINAMALKMEEVEKEDLSSNQSSLEKCQLMVSILDAMLVELKSFEPRSLIEKIQADYNQYDKLSIHFLQAQEDLKKREEKMAERLEAQKKMTLALVEKKCIEQEKSMADADCLLKQAQQTFLSAIKHEEKAKHSLSLETANCDTLQLRQLEALSLASFQVLEQKRALKYEEDCFAAHNEILRKQTALEQELQFLQQKDHELNLAEEKLRLEMLQLRTEEVRQPLDSKLLLATAKEFNPGTLTFYPPKNGSMNDRSFFHEKQRPMKQAVITNSYLSELYLMDQELQAYGLRLQIFGSVATKLTFSSLNTNPQLAQFIPINDVDLSITCVQNIDNSFEISAFLDKYNFSLIKKTQEYIKAKKMHGSLPLDLTIITSSLYKSRRFVPLTMCWAEFINVDDGSERIVNLDPYLLKVFIKNDYEDIFKNAHLEFLVKKPKQKYSHYGDKISDYAHKLFLAMPNIHFSRKVSERKEFIPVNEAYDLLGSYYLEMMQTGNNKSHYEMVYLLSKELSEDQLMFKLPVIYSFYLALITKKRINEPPVSLKIINKMVECAMMVCESILINKNCANRNKQKLIFELDNIANYAIYQFTVAKDNTELPLMTQSKQLFFQQVDERKEPSNESQLNNAKEFG